MRRFLWMSPPISSGSSLSSVIAFLIFLAGFTTLACPFRIVISWFLSGAKNGIDKFSTPAFPLFISTSHNFPPCFNFMDAQNYLFNCESALTQIRLYGRIFHRMIYLGLINKILTVFYNQSSKDSLFS